jgi:hypothetical protein
MIKQNMFLKADALAYLIIATLTIHHPTKHWTFKACHLHQVHAHSVICIGFQPPPELRYTQERP